MLRYEKRSWKTLAWKGYPVSGWVERTYEVSAHTISKELVPNVHKLPLVVSFCSGTGDSIREAVRDSSYILADVYVDNYSAA